MVALSGKGWRLAPSLVAMYEEANRLAPKRNRKADGSIGDTAHASRTSDHNPGERLGDGARPDPRSRVRLRRTRPGAWGDNGVSTYSAWTA